MSGQTSIVIGTYGRDRVLVDTVSALLALCEPAGEVVLVDQTDRHDDASRAQLAAWHEAGAIRWIRQPLPSTVAALNRGLREARGERVLFLDDDILPSGSLVAEHESAFARHPEAWAVVGRVLQPESRAGRSAPRRRKASFTADLDFPFDGEQAGWVTNVMAGNLCVRRDRALEAGGFDENFGPPVAYRFETEFAKRLIRAGGRIWFEPAASVQHLRAASGGTRSQGSHLTSASPVHGVGDYYFALRCGRGWERLLYMARRPFREVRTRFHLRHPWYIPVKLIGEMRAMAMALGLHRRGPRWIGTNRGR